MVCARYVDLMKILSLILLPSKGLECTNCRKSRELRPNVARANKSDVRGDFSPFSCRGVQNIKAKKRESESKRADCSDNNKREIMLSLALVKKCVYCSSTIPTLRDALRQIVSGPLTPYGQADALSERRGTASVENICERGNAKPKSTCSAQSRSAQRANK